MQALAKDVLTLDPQNQDALAFLAAAERASGGPGAAPLTPTTADVAPTESASTPAPTSPSTELRARAEPVEATSFAGGRYQVKSFLGEGGKKKVYLAHDTLLDRDVAFASVRDGAWEIPVQMPWSAWEDRT